MEINENFLVSLKEGINVELKESSNKIPDSLFETYSSFSNTSGGTIYLGIKEGKTNIITGLVNATEQKKTLISTLQSKNKVSYSSFSEDDIQILEVANKKIIRFIIKEAPIEAKPVFINNNLSKSYKRIGDCDFLLSIDEIASFLSANRGVGFDMMPNNIGLNENNIDKESLKKFRKRINDVSPNNLFNSLDDHDFLLRIGALTNLNGKDVLRNGAVLFFGYISDITQIYPNYFLDYQENITNSSRWDRRIVSDDISFNTNIFNFFEVVSNNIIQNLPNPFKTDGISNLNGNDIKRSVIEGLVNALVNCDYSFLPGVVIKKKYETILITNSGDVSIGINQALLGGLSNPFNKNIMNYFRLLQVCDRAGSGVPSIFDVFSSYGFVSPSLSVESEPKRTVLVLNFSIQNKKTPHYEEKNKIISYLTAHEEGASAKQLSIVINKKNSSTVQIIQELISNNDISTNDKKTKGKRYFLAK